MVIESESCRQQGVLLRNGHHVVVAWLILIDYHAAIADPLVFQAPMRREEVRIPPSFTSCAGVRDPTHESLTLVGHAAREKM